MDKERAVFDYRAGNGSASQEEAYFDEHAISSRGEWAENETSIGMGEDSGVMRGEGSDEDRRRISYQRLQDYNEGKYANDRRERTREAARRRDLLTFASHVELSTVQVERAAAYWESVELRNLGCPKVEAVLLACIQHVMHLDNIPTQVELVEDVEGTRTARFIELKEDCSVERGTLNRIERALNEHQPQ